LMELGVEPQSGYGMTENNSHQYTRPGDGADLITGSVGRAVAGYEIRIFDPDDPDTALPQGEIGIVGGRGACLMLGYFNDQYANEASFNADGWFMTGDLGRLDPRGYLTITGRKKEVIIRGGHNINPARIEEIAAGFPGLDRVAVVALPDDRLGERICLALSLRGGAAADIEFDLDALLTHLSARGLSRYEMPEFLLKLDDMPLMANGKIQKADIMTWIRDGKAMPLEIKGQATKPTAER
jgi:acyl-CoA synthetase (AMP-forming)/AMP-acid ligase II